MSDDHSRIARLEEGIKSVCHSLDEMKQAAQRREQKMDSIADSYVRFKEHRESVCRPLHKRLDELDLRAVRSKPSNGGLWELSALLLL